MMPQWHNYPVIAEWPPVNYDFLSATAPEADYKCIETGKVVLREAVMLPNP
jgi:hypothetical protein